METILLDFNEHGHRLEHKHAAADLVLYNSVLGVIIKQLPALTITMAQFRAIFDAPRDYAFDALVGNKLLTIGDMPVSRKYAMDALDWPKSWLAVISAVDTLKKDFSTNTVHTTAFASDRLLDRLDIENIDLVDGKLVFTDGYLQQLKDKHSVYTTTEKQNQVHGHLTKIYQSFTELRKLGVSIDTESAISHLGIKGGSHSINFEPAGIVTSVN